MVKMKKSEEVPLSERILVVLEYVVSHQVPVKPAKMAKDLGIPLASLVRYLQSLVNQGYVFRDDEQGEYGATWRVCWLGDMIKSSFTLRNYVSPFLVDLSSSLKMASCLVVEQNGNLIYLDFIDNPNDGIEGLKRIGKDAPIYCTGSGKILLSSLQDRRRNAIIEQLDMSPLTDRTITDKSVLKQELDKVRSQQYAVDDEECEEGYRCISVPLYDYTGQTIAAISLIDQTDHLQDERVEREILPRLRAITKTISQRLGYMGDPPGEAEPRA